jgi:D-sedoheptulose 7-phosphate isomerase
MRSAVGMTETASRGALDRIVESRSAAGERFFEAEAERIAQLCRLMAERFTRGGRLVAAASSPQGWSDAHHVAVEFVHPVIVGKRALPALAVSAGDVAAVVRKGDMLMTFDEQPTTDADVMTISFSRSGAEWELDPPSTDPYERQELAETAYHVLWELVHVFFDHLGGSTAGAGASSFLYPFLDEGARDLGAVEDDVRRSVLMKAQEAADLRARTIGGGGTELLDAADALDRVFAAGGTLYAFGNGGSATDSMDLVADLRHPLRGGAPRRAVDLAADSAILTALANDIGPDVLFARQLIAAARPGDAAIAFSTSGNSANIVEALAEARRRGLVTIAFVGYDGGRVAEERLADHVVVTPSEHIPRIQEAQATAYHSLCQLLGPA